MAEVLGVSLDTVLNSIKDLESQSEKIRFGKIQGSHGGKPYYALDEAQITALKLKLQSHHNLEGTFEASTRLEKQLYIAKALRGKALLRSERNRGYGGKNEPTKKFVGYIATEN